MSLVATVDPLWKMQSTDFLSMPGGARKERLSVGQWVHNSRLPNGRVSADGNPERTDDGQVVRDFELEPTAREV